MSQLRYGLAAALLATSGVDSARADEWPQWRGPRRDGTSLETGLQLDWGEEGPPLVWQREGGGGFSGISVVEGRAYTMWSDAESEYTVALDAASGEELWRVRTGARFERGDGRDGPRATPTLEGDRLYVMSGTGTLLALSTRDGRTLWSHNLVEEFGAELPVYGFASSPLLEGNLLVIGVGGSEGRAVMAFDKQDGSVVWGAHDDATGYSSAIAFDGPGGRQFVLLNAGTVSSVSLEGEVLWTYAWPAWPVNHNLNINTPLAISDNRIFISSSYDVGSVLLEVREVGEAIEVEEVWKSRVMKNHFQSSVFHEGHLYGFDNAILKCVVAATGEECWRHRGLGKGQLILVDGHLIVLGERGKLAAVEATPKAYREIALVQVLNERCWTPPTLADGGLFIRTERRIMSFDLTRDSRHASGAASHDEKPGLGGEG